MRVAVLVPPVRWTVVLHELVVDHLADIKAEKEKRNDRCQQSTQKVDDPADVDVLRFITRVLRVDLRTGVRLHALGFTHVVSLSVHVRAPAFQQGEDRWYSSADGPSTASGSKPPIRPARQPEP